MSKFDDFINTVGHVANKAVNETAKFTDTATTKVKIKAEEARLCEKYEALGRLSYEKFEGEDNLPENIVTAMKEIEDQITKINSLNAEYQAKKEKNKQSDTSNNGDTQN